MICECQSAWDVKEDHSKLILIWLVVKKTIWKNDGVRQWLVDDIPYMKWKIKFLFETTNHSCISYE
jgi:hypothetical protein